MKREATVWGGMDGHVYPLLSPPVADHRYGGSDLVNHETKKEALDGRWYSNPQCPNWNSEGPHSTQKK